MVAYLFEFGVGYLFASSASFCISVVVFVCFRLLPFVPGVVSCEVVQIVLEVGS